MASKDLAKIEVQINLQRAKEQVNQLAAYMDAQLNKPVNLKMDPKGAKSTVADVRKELEKLEQRIMLKVSPDMAKFAIRQIKDELQSISGQKLNLNAGAGFRQLRQEATGFQNTLAGINSGLAALGVTIGASLLVRFGRDLISQAGAVRDFSDEVAVSTTTWQAWAASARDAGLEQTQVVQAISKVRNAVAELRSGTDQGYEALRRFGLSAKDFSGMGTAESVQKVAQAFMGIRDEEQRAAAMTALFGERIAAKLIPVMKEWADTSTLVKDRMGEISSEKTINDADKLDDQLSQLAANMKRDLLPTAITVGQVFNEIFGAASRIGNGRARGWGEQDKKPAQRTTEQKIADLGGPILAPGVTKAPDWGEQGGTQQLESLNIIKLRKQLEASTFAASIAGMKDEEAFAEKLNEAKRQRLQLEQEIKDLEAQSGGTSAEAEARATSMLEKKDQQAKLTEQINAGEKSQRLELERLQAQLDSATLARKNATATHQEQINNLAREQATIEAKIAQEIEGSTTWLKLKKDLTDSLAKSERIAYEDTQEIARLDQEIAEIQSRSDRTNLTLGEQYRAIDNQILQIDMDRNQAGLTAVELKRLERKEVELIYEKEQKRRQLEAWAKSMPTKDASESRYKREVQQVNDAQAEGFLTPSDASAARALLKWQHWNSEKARIHGETDIRLAANDMNMFEAFTSGMKRSLDDWGTGNQHMAEMGAQFTGKLSSGFADAFMSFVDGSKDAGQAFEDMTVSIISDMLRMQLQQQAMSLMQGMMGTPQYSGGTVHNGGIVGEAPIRYLHNGTTGNRLVPGDRPAMLKDGEEVVTQQGQRDRARASRAPQVNNAIFIDQKQFADFMLKNPHYVAQIFNGNPSLFRR